MSDNFEQIPFEQVHRPTGKFDEDGNPIFEWVDESGEAPASNVVFDGDEAIDLANLIDISEEHKEYQELRATWNRDLATYKAELAQYEEKWDYVDKHGAWSYPSRPTEPKKPERLIELEKVYGTE